MTAISARTSNTWIKPPRVYELTTPRNHRTNRTTKSVHNMALLAMVERQRASAPHTLVRRDDDRRPRSRRLTKHLVCQRCNGAYEHPPPSFSVSPARCCVEVYRDDPPQGSPHAVDESRYCAA